MPDRVNMPAPTPITICSVSYHHAPHLRLNIELAAELNPGSDIRWLIGENTPAGNPLRLENPVAHHVDVVATEGLIPEKKRPQDFHTSAMEALIERVTTRFMLILDPDFFPIMAGWADQVVTHMQANRLALFGAPWHPRHIQKYRYFPAVHCTFVDREAFKDQPYTVKSLRDGMRGLSLKDRFSAPGIPASALGQKWRSGVLSRLFPKRWKQSWAIRDTGSALYSRYWTGETIPNECLTPVFDPAGQGGAVQAMLDKILPDDLSYVPKRRDSFSRSGQFLPQIPETQDWEAFLWRAKPFGFHMRGNWNRGQRNPQAEVEMVREIIKQVTNTAVR